MKNYDPFVFLPVSATDNGTESRRLVRQSFPPLLHSVGGGGRSEPSAEDGFETSRAGGFWYQLFVVVGGRGGVVVVGSVAYPTSQFLGYMFFVFARPTDGSGVDVGVGVVVSSS